MRDYGESESLGDRRVHGGFPRLGERLGRAACQSLVAVECHEQTRCIELGVELDRAAERGVGLRLDGAERAVRRVTTPKPPLPPPFRAQKSLGFVRALAMRTAPSAVTISASGKLAPAMP